MCLGNVTHNVVRTLPLRLLFIHRKQTSKHKMNDAKDVVKATTIKRCEFLFWYGCPAFERKTILSACIIYFDNVQNLPELELATINDQSITTFYFEIKNLI